MFRISHFMAYISVILTSFIITTLNMSFASPGLKKPTIYESSIKWGDQKSRLELLKTVPKWHDDVIKLLFEVYKNPARYQLQEMTDTQKYTIQFINAFWGPVNNPFTKYERPAKAFLFITQPTQHNQVKTSSDEIQAYYLVPLIQNIDNEKYYVFDKGQTGPIILEDWIERIKHIYSNQALLRFNLCNAYGNLPTDSCEKTYYQSEVSFTKKNLLRSKNAFRPSAHRELYENWRTKVQALNFLKPEESHYIYRDSIDWENTEVRNILLNTVTAWANYPLIVETFKKLRDLRYLTDEEMPPFLRRISWLYPDDGCWTRASAAIRDLFGPFNNVVNQLPRPSKVFIFGNLCANTKNSANGYVAWWYHTAPIIKDAETNQTYVLDPSINPYEPMALEQWALEISSNTGACSGTNSYIEKFAICTGFGTSPYEKCHDPAYVNFSTETSSALEQHEFQIEERERQTELGRDANLVLGDLPPWLTVS